jgi:UPF0271 protein
VAAVDLNADLGEGFGIWPLGDDEAMLAVVTSANVACGAHAGDPSTMRRVCRDAAARGVAIGAQVGYPDLHGFGRRFIDVDPDELADSVLAQLGALEAFARAAGTRVRYVKPHGALYHAADHHDGQAGAVVDAARAFDRALAIVGPPGSLLLERAERAGLRPVAEGFADRAYRPDGRLVDRRAAGAVITDPEHVARQAHGLAVEGRVRTVDGTEIHLAIETLCVHGDTAGAVTSAGAIRSVLADAGVALRPFVDR